MIGALPIALNLTTTLEESFFLYVSKAASACGGKVVPSCIAGVAEGLELVPGASVAGNAGVNRPVSAVDDAITPFQLFPDIDLERVTGR